MAFRGVAGERAPGRKREAEQRAGNSTKSRESNTRYREARPVGAGSKTSSANRCASQVGGGDHHHKFHVGGLNFTTHKSKRAGRANIPSVATPPRQTSVGGGSFLAWPHSMWHHMLLLAAAVAGYAIRCCVIFGRGLQGGAHRTPCLRTSVRPPVLAGRCCLGRLARCALTPQAPARARRRPRNTPPRE